MSLVWELAILLALILANGFFSGAELAILTARRSRLEQDAKGGNRSARLALALANDPDRFLPTVQVGITLIGTLTGVFGGATLVRYLMELLGEISGPLLDRHAGTIAMVIVVAGISYFSLVLGELVPKQVALSRPEQLARLVARPMRALAIATRPFVWLLGASTKLVLLALQVKPPSQESVSIEDIEHLLRSGYRQGVLDPTEQRMAHRALRLGERSVREIIRPRVEIEGLAIDTPIDQVIQVVADSGYSRLPVYEGDLDHIIGFVYSKDLLRLRVQGETIDLRSLMRPALFIPESLTIDRLLTLLREQRTQLAIVLDEYGGTRGLVTLEDVLEELVGEIHDEQRVDEDQTIVRRDETSWLVDGSVALTDMFDHLAIEDPTAGASREFNTVAGLVFATLGRIPAVGERLTWNGLELEVVDMDGPRVDRLLVTVLPRPVEEPDPWSLPDNS